MAIVAMGCRSNDSIDDVDVNEDKLYGDYWAEYDANTNISSFVAQLRVGGSTGTTVRLTGGRMTVDGRPMSEHYGDSSFFNARGTYYFLKQSGIDLQAYYELAWDRSDGGRVVNQIEMPGPVEIVLPEHDERIPRDDVVIGFEGRELTGRERVTVGLTAEHPEGRGGRRTITRSVTAGNEVVFTRLEMQQFLPDSVVTVRLAVKSKVSPDEGHQAEGGRISIRYLAESANFILGN